MQAAPTATLDVRPFDAALGAEIAGIDLAKPLDGRTREKILDAWHEYSALLIRNQTRIPAHAAAARLSAMRTTEKMKYQRRLSTLLNILTLPESTRAQTATHWPRKLPVAPTCAWRRRR